MLRSLIVAVALIPSVAFSAPLCWHGGIYEDARVITASGMESDEEVCEFVGVQNFDGTPVKMLCISAVDDEPVPPDELVISLRRDGKLLIMNEDYSEPFTECVEH